MRTVANLQLIYAMRPYEECNWLLLGFTAVEEIERLLEGLRVQLAVVLYFIVTYILFIIQI